MKWTIQKKTIEVALRSKNKTSQAFSDKVKLRLNLARRGIPRALYGYNLCYYCCKLSMEKSTF